MPYPHCGPLRRISGQPGRSGFTLIELTVAVAVLIILTTIAMWATKQWLIATEVRTAANDLVGVLELAQSKAISAEAASPYTVCGGWPGAPKNVYRITLGETCASPEVSRHTFPGQVEFINVMGVPLSPPANDEWMIVFEKLTGRARQIPTISVGTITLADPSGPQATVTVTNEGVISTP